ncbi:MAG: 8-amino-7-oxononanoate synthase [Clostridium sp.]|uniref:8-amino-7-oxononanoate synthase n=1 Tax=Clostridium sp. TaxID=1506 RepID=UPI002FC5CA51
MKTLKENNLYRKLNYIQTSQQPRVKINNKSFLLFGSNNYLGIADSPILKKSAIESINHYGIGSGGSRLTTGSYDVHRMLEVKLAKFKHCDDAIIYSSGYMANIGVISSLCNRHWTVFSDKLNHASIIDGIKLSGAKMVRYNHCDTQDLISKIKKNKGQYNLLVTDGIFSMDGDIAPLNDIVSICKKEDILTMVDDAHGTGVLGDNGSGCEDFLNLKNAIDIKVGTLSKAIGCEGGFVCSSYEVIDYLRNTSRSFIYSTSLSPVLASCAITSINYIERNHILRESLIEKSSYFKVKLKEIGLNTLFSITPIIPIFIGDSRIALKFSSLLYEEGIYIPCIRPPTVPEGTSRLRISLMATHSYDEIDYALKLIKKIANELKIIGD